MKHAKRLSLIPFSHKKQDKTLLSAEPRVRGLGRLSLLGLSIVVVALLLPIASWGEAKCGGPVGSATLCSGAVASASACPGNRGAACPGMCQRDGSCCQAGNASCGGRGMGAALNETQSAALLQGNGPFRGRGRNGHGPRGRGRAFGRVGDATGLSFQSVRGDFQQLVHNHTKIVRSVVEIPEGVRTITLTSDPELLKVLRRHPREIRQYLEDGGRVRMWDPLFVEMIQQKDHIQMEVQEIQNGVEVTLTADHPEVVRLVRAHAAKVSDMVQRGPASAHEETSLPKGYAGPTN
ncbi:MAG: hypothetical protein H6752_05125 [Candidatus Omnitrophica bacterium]|nr:hypothetical protein [Candidatus Omnitrophota bacterium]